MRGNDWATQEANAFHAAATMYDLKRIAADMKYAEALSDSAYDAGFEAGVLASEAGLGRYND